MDAIDELDSIDNAIFYLEYDFVNKRGLPLPQLLLNTLDRLPSRGKITKFKDIVAIDAATTLIDRLSEVEPKKQEIARKLYEVQTRMF